MAKLDELEMSPLSGSRDMVLDAARRLIAEEGVENATVRRIAQAAGLSPGRIIQQFGSKGRLMFELYRRRNRATDAGMIARIEAASGRRNHVRAFFEGMMERDFDDLDLSCEVMAHSWRWTEDEDAAYLEELQHYIRWLAAILAGDAAEPARAHYLCAAHMIGTYVSYVNRAVHIADLRSQLLETLMEGFDFMLAGLDARKPGGSASPA